MVPKITEEIREYVEIYTNLGFDQVAAVRMAIARHWFDTELPNLSADTYNLELGLLATEIMATYSPFGE